MTIFPTTPQASISTPPSKAMRCRAALLPLLVASLVGCGVTPAFSKEPLASGEVVLPPGTAVSRLFACAEKTVLSLSQTQNNWDDRITLRDEAGGRFETGHFPDQNVMGFRVSVRFVEAAPSAQVQLKGAGPYFVDLGVDGAVKTFVEQTTACLAPT